MALVQIWPRCQLHDTRINQDCPYVDDTTSMTGKEQFVLKPLVTSPLVKSAGDDLVVFAVTHVLFEEKMAVKTEQRNLATSAEHDISRDIADPCALQILISIVDT